MLYAPKLKKKKEERKKRLISRIEESDSCCIFYVLRIGSEIVIRGFIIIIINYITILTLFKKTFKF